MTRISLPALAHEMRHELNGRDAAQVECRLGSDGYVGLKREHNHYELLYGFRSMMPDPTEAAFVAQIFGAPVDEPTRVSFWLPTQDGQKIVIKAIRYVWSEAA